MVHSICCLFLVSCLAATVGGRWQTEECPKGWVPYGTNCYKFIRAPLKSRDAAFDSCRYLNAILLSIDSMEEHSFILDWLRENDPQHRTWYTSGVDVGNNQWRWQTNDRPFIGLESAWLPENAYLNYRFAAYNFSVSAGRWGLLEMRGDEETPYVCKVRKDMLNLVVREERGYEYGLIIKDKDQVPKAPYFIKEPEDAVFDMSARNDVSIVQLRCLAGGYPHPTYRWFKEVYINDRLEKQDVKPLSNERITISDGTLSFYNPLQVVDRGTFYCEASNKFGTIVSRTAQLTFGYIGQFNLKRSTETGREYWGKAIYCDPPSHYPDVSYYWARDFMPNFVDEDRRVFVSQDGNLYFSSLETIDRGEYSCVVQSSVSGTGRTGPFFTLEVQSYSSNQQLQFPNSFPKAFPEAPIAGQDVHLECLAFGYPVPSYNWTRKGFSSQLPRNSSMTKYNRVLVLPKVAVEDMGEYVCTANNGRNSISASVTLSIQALPVFTIPLEDMHMDEGGDLVWNCEAFGIPDVRYEWLKNGEFLGRVISAEDAQRYLIRDNVLTIRVLNPSRDQGVYQCKATNQLGSTYSSGELRILTFPPSFLKYPVEKETFAAESGNVTIACRPEAAPTPTFQWVRNGQVLVPDGRRVIVQPNGYLFINGVQRIDEGRYTCKAANRYGRAESDGYLFVLQPPTFVRSPPLSLTAQINQTIRLSCEVHSPSVLDLSYLWLVNGLRADEFPHQRFVTDLEPGSLLAYNLTFYDFGSYECQAITPVHRITRGTWLSIEGPPGPSGGLQALPDQGRNVKLQWTDGSTHGRPVTSFDIEGRTGWNDTWVLIMKDVMPPIDRLSGRRQEIIGSNMLSPWSQYEFRVIAKNMYGVGLPSPPSPAYSTDQSRPMKYPQNIGGGGGNVGDLTLTWTPLPPQEWNAPGVWYRIFYKPADKPENDYRQEDLRSLGNIGMKVVRVGNQNYYKEYTIKVQAFNNKGPGPISPEVVIFSAEDRPNAVPVEVSAWPHNSTCLNVSWKPIELTRENIRGKLVGFRIKYWRQGKDDPKFDATYHLSRKVQNWALIVGLMPDTYYAVVAMAFNGAGSGTESEPFIMRTFKSAPLQPPTSVKIDALSPSSIRVTWRASAPSQVEEPLAGFKVRYWEADQDFSSYQDVYVPLGGILSTDVYGLKPGVRYKLRVLAYSQGGDGRMSSPAWEFQLGDADTLRGGSVRTDSSLVWVPMMVSMMAALLTNYL